MTVKSFIGQAPVVFVPGNLFQPNLMFVSKAKCSSLGYAPGLTLKHQTRLERLSKDQNSTYYKHSFITEVKSLIEFGRIVLYNDMFSTNLKIGQKQRNRVLNKLQSSVTKKLIKILPNFWKKVAENAKTYTLKLNLKVQNIYIKPCLKP